MRTDKRASHKPDKKPGAKGPKQGVVGYSKKSALLEEAITHMNAGKYGRSSATLKELLVLDPQNMEARRLFATLHLRLGSLVTAREAFESLANEAIGRQDYWLAESLLREYLAAGPRCIPFLELLAHVYEEKGDAMAAVAELGKAIEILLEDPDPDHPQKPSQLYGRIRELAPASPVAFQFASSFDIQTGEFRRQPREGEPLRDGEDPPQGDASTISDRTNPMTEVMPWERLDESVPPVSSPASMSSLEDHSTALASTPPVREMEVPLVERPPSPLAVPALSAGASAFGLPSEHEAVVVESQTALDRSPEESPDPVLPRYEPDLASVSPSLSISESVFDSVNSADAPATEPPSMPSRMPWEHVADPGLEIVEPEPPVVTEPPVVAESSADKPAILESEPASSPALSTESSSIPLSPPTSSEYPAAIDQRGVIGAEPIIQPAESTGESQPSPTPSSSLSFSWNAIFDSAWKIAVGTTAPGTPDIPKEPESTVAAESDVPPALLDRLVETSEPPSMPSAGAQEVETSVPAPPLEFSIAPTTPVMPSSSDPQRQSGVPEPLWTQATSLQSSSELSEPSPVEEPRILEPAGVDAVASSPAVGDPMGRTVENQGADNVPSEPAQFDAALQKPSPEFRLAPDTETVPAAALTESAHVQEPLVKDMSPDVAGANATTGTATPSSETDAWWNTGEVAVQHYRPTVEKKTWAAQSVDLSEPPRPAASADAPTESVSELSQGWEATGADKTVATVLPGPAEEEPVPPPQDTRPEWVQASDAIVLAQPAAPASAMPLLRSESFGSFEEPSRSSVAAAVDALFGGSGQGQAIQTTEHTTPPRSALRWSARLARLRFTVTSLLGSCFSTTRAFVLLCVSLAILSLVVLALGVGVLAVSWIAMEEAPTPRYQTLTSGPQRTITDPKSNGYLLLLGFDAPSGGDPLKVGYERKPDEQDLSQSQGCMSEHEVKTAASGTGSGSGIVDGWFKRADPIVQAKAGSDALRSLLAKETTSLSRYQQYLGMPFDDWGFGQMLSPNCAHMLLTHRLYLMEGFNQDLVSGVTRLEKDMESWRAVLGQSKTLMMKMLAVAAVQDDVRLASSVLTRSDADAAVINRLSKIVRPLDQLELSVRWPMQSQFAWATRNVAADLKKYRTEAHPLYVSMAAAMPLPVQRRANAYAEYYEAANKAVAEGRYVNLPKRSQFVRTSAMSFVDYWANPLEHVIGIDPLPSWDSYVGRMVETDAQLRLASLQLWVRRGPQEGDVLTRLAKAGQAYYDPFTGFPMLINQEKRLLYSVGRDGKDQGGDPGQDVVVAIPSLQSGAVESKRASK
ncbi:MAG: protein of unknown function [Nitrospira sp.]